MSRRVSTLFLVSALLVLGVPALADHHITAWDQDAIAHNLDRLVKSASNIRMGLVRGASDEEKDPERETPSVREVVFRDLSEIQRRAVALQGLVRGGQSYEATLPLYRHLRSDIANAAADAEDFPEIQKQQSHIDAAQKAIDSLDAYYGYGTP